jgi:hypothetical protein
MFVAARHDFATDAAKRGAPRLLGLLLITNPARDG